MKKTKVKETKKMTKEQAYKVVLDCLRCYADAGDKECDEALKILKDKREE